MNPRYPPRRHFGRYPRPRLRVRRFKAICSEQPKFNYLVVLERDADRLLQAARKNGPEWRYVLAGVICRKRILEIDVKYLPDEAAIRAFGDALAPGGRGRRGGQRALWLQFDEEARR